MKRFLLIAASAGLMTACNPGPRPAAQGATSLTPAQAVPNIDTVGLAAFQAWKVQNELEDYQEFKQSQNNIAAPAPQRTTSRSVASAPRRSSTSRASSGSSGGSANNTASYPAKKKGWSKAAKGAVIGGVAGAAGGAIINKKNRAVGAVVGGVLGAGGGYGIGRGMDKRDGRY